METIDVFDLIERMSALIRSEERKKCADLGLHAVHLQALNYILLCKRGVAIFAKACFGHLSPSKRQKLRDR